MKNNWPYPKWIAHRGAGKLAPENTLAALRVGAGYGYRMFECDVKLSADGVPFLLHDHTLDRTSSGRGVAGEKPWEALSRLDAGAWHSRSFAGEPIPTFDNIAGFCIANGYALNIEIKPSEYEGKNVTTKNKKIERLTGEVVAKRASQLWAGQAVQPLLTSFKPEALVGAKKAASELPRGLLVDELWDGWFETAQDLGCVCVVLNYKLWTKTLVAQVKRKKMRCSSYTVNDVVSAKALWDMGLDGIITDRVDLFSPA